MGSPHGANPSQFHGRSAVAPPFHGSYGEERRARIAGKSYRRHDGGSMTRVHVAMQFAAAGLIAGSCLVIAQPAPAAGVLAPHRAVYDLKLSKSRGKRSIEMVRGRILYDFSGNTCEGYALQFRQVSEIDSGEGKVALSDLRAATWEEGDAKSFRFNSQNNVNDRVVDAVDGNAGRDSAGISVTLSKPKAKNFNLDAKIVFPTEHMRRIIEA